MSKLTIVKLLKSTLLATALTAVFTMANAPLYAIPSEHNTIVKVGNTILNAGYNIQYTIPANSQREFPLEIFQMPAGSLDVADIKSILKRSSN